MSEPTLDRMARVVVRRDLEIHRSHLGPYAARWHFSFADYQDLTHIGIGALRVFNHEELPPAARLVPHSHSHAQCVTYVISGEFQHRDAVLESGRLDAGGVQRMTLTSAADQSGDAAVITEEGMVEVEAHRPTELMLVDTRL